MCTETATFDIDNATKKPLQGATGSNIHGTADAMHAQTEKTTFSCKED